MSGNFEQFLLLTSVQNARVKDVISLRDRRDRDRTSRFTIEGYRELLRAVDAGSAFEALFICPELFLGSNEGALIARMAAASVPIWRCSTAVFERMSYRDRPDGLIAVAPQRTRSLLHLDNLLADKAAPFLVVAEAIEKPGNLGTILRSCDAVGVDALIACDRCTDLHNPNVVRASVGTLFTVPVIEAEGEATLQTLRQRGIRILAATPAANAEYTDVDLTGPLAIAVGTEQLGLSQKWMQQSDIQVRIPMCGVADSLNVAMATTLLLYEVLRQRRRLSTP